MKSISQNHTTIPNIFSPNSDNQNDYIDLSNLNLVEEIVDIYNRWGTKVFQSSFNITKWDGKDLKGNDCAEGVYYYVFHYSEFINKTIDKKGFIQLVR
ncbi:MAG: gliding motility-associated C-terminal domain-containing protein [Bacteroidetes bacterium]|nr:gliding motility-associated C-terminal domain-containing protein [Bacteroidota bacterium]